MTHFLIARALVMGVVVCLLSALSEVAGQPQQIGIIDLYGLSRVSADQVRAALTFKVGDTIPFSGEERRAFLAASETRVAALPGVARARIEVVCCDQGRSIVYVGVEETGALTTQYHAAPLDPVRLAPDIVLAGEEFLKALEQAVQRGQAEEDRSEGHALNRDPALRAIQERFSDYARRDLPALRLVLRSSSDATHRALAAQVLGYANDKQAVVGDLVQGMADPSESVRNNAMRTLLVFAEAVPTASRPRPRVPFEPFVALLNSLIWTDRNKSSGSLMALSEGRDPKLLAALRAHALTSLVEMARWKSAGHALAPFLILGRLAGYPDDTAFGLWERGEREAVITAAIKGRLPGPR